MNPYSRMHQILQEHGLYFADGDPDGSFRQALFCPWYVPLEGGLGSDWGVIINPQSTKFGRLVFEHDWCGCCKNGDEPYGQQRENEWKAHLPLLERRLSGLAEDGLPANPEFDVDEE